MNYWQVLGDNFLGQGKYVVDILRRFEMEDYRLMATPMVTNMKNIITLDSELVDLRICKKLIGYLMYLVSTRLDICFVVNTLIHLMVESRQVHWIAAKHVLGYFKGIVEYGLRYLGGDGVQLQGHSNSNWTRSVVDRKITLGCCFSLGSAMITWFSRKQTSVALSLVGSKIL
jgi:hypothetical protein